MSDMRKIMNLCESKQIQLNEASEYQLVATFINWDSTEDSYNEGEIGETNTIISEKINIKVNSIDELLEEISSQYGVSSDKKDWGLMDGEEGRLVSSMLVNNDNEKVSESEIASWKNGELKLWSAHIDVYVEMIKSYKPSSEELSKVTGLEAI